MEPLHFSTRILHTPYQRDDAHNALRMPVYDNVAFEFESAEEHEAAFRGSIARHVYSRITNPTVEHFENQIRTVTGALGVIALSTGMAAISNLIIAIAGQGENIITTRKLFGNTYSLFVDTLSDLGIEFRFADFTHPETIEPLIDENTRAVFFETITNPQMEVANVEQLAAITSKNQLLLLADSTVTPPYLFNSRKFGIDVEVISSTKFISGGATSLGGIIIDNGTYNWEANRKLAPLATKYGSFALLGKLRKEVARNLGASLSAHNAFLQSLGLESLTLRVDKACQNALQIAQWLEFQDKVIKVTYPGLKSSPYHALSQSQFGNRAGAVLTFDLHSKEQCFQLINGLKIIRKATNLNDNKSLIIHPASTIFCEYSDETLQTLDVRHTTIRLAVGIEEVTDIINDLKQAFENLINQ
jgi:O-acetylhomoserine (thiol)-lyase